MKLLKKSQEIKKNLREMAGPIKNPAAHASYHLPDTKMEMLKDAPLAGIMYDKSLDPDIRFPLFKKQKPSFRLFFPSLTACCPSVFYVSAYSPLSSLNKYRFRYFSATYFITLE